LLFARPPVLSAARVLAPMMFIFFMFVLLKLSHFPERCAPVEMSRCGYMRSPPGETISPNAFNFYFFGFPVGEVDFARALDLRSVSVQIG